MIRLFVGLGNPGAGYEATRHNAGFWWLDGLASHWKAALVQDKSIRGEMSQLQLSGSKRWLLKPQTFMNLSGHAVAALARFYKIAPEQILVVHDELDLLPGQAKLKFGGGHAGHNGLRDIHAQLGTDQYWRLRLGIGHPGIKSEVVHWVLMKPSLDERQLIDQASQRALSAVNDLLNGNMEAATRIIHTDTAARPAKARQPNLGDPSANIQPPTSPQSDEH